MYDLTLRFLPWFVTFDPRLQAEIREGLSSLVATDAEWGVLLAFSSFFRLLSCWTATGSERERRQGADEARRAVMAESKQITSHSALSFALLDAGDAQGALAEAEVALSLGGKLMLTGFVLALAGDWERGTAIIRAHLAVLKRYPGCIHHAFVLDAYRRGDYAAALAEAEAIATPNLAWDPLDRAVCLARLGRIEEARAAGRELCAILPAIDRDPRVFVARMTADEALIDDLVEALRLAGIG
jgi:tetratricopeptide (TPR) repeat protein